MSKSILIIDTPNCCKECQFCFEDEDIDGITKTYCALRQVRIICDIDKEIDKCCRLKKFNVNSLKVVNKDFHIYERNFLLKNLDREFEILKRLKEFIGDGEWVKTQD